MTSCLCHAERGRLSGPSVAHIQLQMCWFVMTPHHNLMSRLYCPSAQRLHIHQIRVYIRFYIPPIHPCSVSPVPLFYLRIRHSDQTDKCASSAEKWRYFFAITTPKRWIVSIWLPQREVRLTYNVSCSSFSRPKSGSTTRHVHSCRFYFGALAGHITGLL